jgi:hypothetical protein
LKWNGNISASSSLVQRVGNSPYDCTDTLGITSNCGFEEKNGYNSLYIKISSATSSGFSCVADKLATPSSLDQTSSSVKCLPAVSENISVFGKIFADNISGDRDACLALYFYDEDGLQIGSAIEIPVSSAGEWEKISENIEVPSGATRVNWILKSSVGSGESCSVWLRDLRIF